jgi:predicted phosphate transport protein (TIGR00153 family)
MAKGDKFYFDNFAAGTALSKKAAEFLVACLEGYDPKSIEKMMASMHEIEHQADMKKHEMNATLAKAFVTPIDREDLDMLSHKLDDVTDMIEEVLQKFYTNNIQTVEPGAIEFAKKIVKACDMLCQLMAEFENFKRSKTIQGLIISLNDVEEECDKLYLKSLRDLSVHCRDALLTLAWRDIYEHLEACADACEHVSECVGTVIMKNT